MLHTLLRKKNMCHKNKDLARTGPPKLNGKSHRAEKHQGNAGRKERYHLGSRAGSSSNLQVFHTVGALRGADGRVAEGQGGDAASVLGTGDVLGLGADPR